MTMVREMTVRCPDCGSRNNATIYLTVNVSLDPSLKDRLLSGELLRSNCAECGARWSNAYPLLYHDMNLGILINYIRSQYASTNEDLAAVLPSYRECRMFKKLRSDYRFRVVREFDDLIEKIHIFEAGLDDRAVEWEKFLYVNVEKKEEKGQSSDGDLDIIFDQPRFLRCIEASGKKQMEFICPAPGLSSVPLSLVGPDSIYQRALQHIETHLPWPESINGAFLLVDQDYIRRAWRHLPDISEGHNNH